MKGLRHLVLKIQGCKERVCDQNIVPLKQISQGVPELWSDKQTNKQINIIATQYLLMKQL